VERPLDERISAFEVEPDRPGPEPVGVVHEEIDRLPDKYRNPVVLCCLEQLTYEQAARQLGTSEPTLRGRLHRGRRRLAARLRARGVSLSCSLPPGEAATRAPSRVSPPLVDATVHLCLRWSAIGNLIVGAAPPSIHFLAQGVIRTMFWNTVKVAAIPALFTAGVLGTAVLAQQGRSAGDQLTSHASQGIPKQESGPQPASPTRDIRAIDRERKRQTKEQAIQTFKGELMISLDEKSAHIRDLLARRYDLDLPPKAISLEEFLKAVKKATAKEGDPGIPIYVNPRGLQEAQITMESKVIVSEVQTLGETLRYVLRSTGLSYSVRDGLLMIDSRIGVVEGRLDDLDRKLDRILKAVERHDRGR
jgi:hypothetical protein